MFKNYHIVIFKDREGEFLNLRVRGWITTIFLLLIIGLSALCFYLWDYYAKAQQLEQELAQAKEIIKTHDSQVLTLTNKLLTVEGDLHRIQEFNAKLRVLMNIGEGTSIAQPKEGDDPITSDYSAIINNPAILAKHRELFTKYAYSLVDELIIQASLEEVGQQEIVHFMRTNKEILLSTPSIWPADGFLSSGFGMRSSPFTGKRILHKGIDIANRHGTPIWAPAKGVVTFAGNDAAYGLSIVLDHGNNISTRYAHLQKILVQPKQVVHRGDVIGNMGSTGRSTGPHLHYEVHVGGVPVNPMRYIFN